MLFLVKRHKLFSIAVANIIESKADTENPSPSLEVKLQLDDTQRYNVIWIDSLQYKVHWVSDFVPGEAVLIDSLKPARFLDIALNTQGSSCGNDSSNYIITPDGQIFVL